MQTINILHTDGKTQVKAKVFIVKDEVHLDWRLGGMGYGTTITKELYESIKKKQTN
ncbi:MAG: hypothetical protein V4560_14880 [Bacteroidota bacterium]